MSNSNIDDDKVPAMVSNVNDIITTFHSSNDEDDTESATADTADTPITTNVSKMESNVDVLSAFPREEEVLEGQGIICCRKVSDDVKIFDAKQHATTKTSPVTKNGTSTDDDAINTTQSAFSYSFPLSAGELSEDDQTEPQGVHFTDSSSDLTSDDEDNDNEIQLDSTSAVTPTSPPSLLEEKSIRDQQQEGKGTPSTFSSSATSGDSFSSFSSSEESHFSFILEDTFEQQHSVTGGILQLFMQQRDIKREDRMQLELKRELQESSDEEAQTQRRRKPSAPSRRRRPDHSERTRRKDIRKTLQYSNTKEDESVVHENKKTRKSLGDDFMLQEEIWLSMFCNAVPASILDYFGASATLPKKRRARSRHVTDQGQKLNQEQERCRHHRQRRLGEEHSIQSDGEEVPESISFDPIDPGAQDSVSAFTGHYDDDELNQEAHRMVQELESKKPDGTLSNDISLSTILEEGESELLEKSMDALLSTVSTPQQQPSTTPPFYRPPTFAC